MVTQATINLLRHGETTGGMRYCGSTDHALTETGWRQMWASVERTPMQWQHIITSPLQRCARFAQALAERCAIPLIEEARLREIHLGAWEGRSAAELMLTDAAALARFWQNPLDYPPPQAEHLLAFRARILAAWHDIQVRFAGQHILLVTHSGVMRLLVCHIQQRPMQHLLEIEVPYAAMKTVEVIWHDKGCQATLKTGHSA
ncbi:MAG TPA: alpha-ribazole phosphatase family protein [Nitrosomonas halophila]|nr:alpha-ribazole phosphatase family protein [Nitrosomonas halophila]